MARKVIRRTKKVFGTAKYPRLSVARSNKRIFAQVIDDTKGVTIAAASDGKLDKKLTKTEKASIVGQNLGEKLIKMGIKTVHFDRGRFIFHGRIQALADSVKKTGVKI